MVETYFIDLCVQEKKLDAQKLDSGHIDYTVFYCGTMILLVFFLILKIFGAQIGQKVNILVVMCETFLFGILSRSILVRYPYKILFCTIS